MSATVFTGTMLFSRIIPIILGFLGVILITSGIMDDEKLYTIIGASLFVIAAAMPFIVLPLLI